jgi:hypothetical protein
MSLDVVARIENTLNKAIMVIGQELSVGALKQDDAITIILLAVRGGGNDIDDKQMRILCAENGIAGNIKTAGELLTLALSVDDSEKKTETP